jgi:hypothetical protein
MQDRALRIDSTEPHDGAFNRFERMVRTLVVSAPPIAGASRRRASRPWRSSRHRRS